MYTDFFQNLISTPFGWIIIICVAIFFGPQLLGSSQQQINFYFAKINSAISDGEWYRLLTSIFLHSGILHLFLNMYSLYVISPQVMSIYGYFGKNPNLSFYLIFLVSGLSGSLVSYFLNPNNSLGASGAIFGLIGSLLAVGVFKNDYEIVKNVAQVVLINVIFGLSGGVDNTAHFGGLAGGFAVGAILLLV
jgi:rhomboid protease GluP